MIRELIEKIRYFFPVLFSEEDRIIFVIVLMMIVMLPLFLCVLRHKPLVRGTALIIFAVYILGNLSFTILGREVFYPDRRPTFENYRQAFSLDYFVTKSAACRTDSQRFFPLIKFAATIAKNTSPVPERSLPSFSEVTISSLPLS